MKHLKIKKIWIWILFAILLAAAAAGAYLNGGIAADTEAAGRGEVKKVLKEAGTVESESAVTVTAKNSGEIQGLMVEEGTAVNAGDTLMVSDGTSAALDIKSQQAELTGLQAQYNQAREVAKTNKALYEQGALSYDDYNTSNTEAKQLASQITSLKYAIESYAESTGAAGVKAPIAGVITGVYVTEGESVSSGTPLFEISNLNDIYVKADFIAEDADLINAGDQVRIHNDDSSFEDEDGSVKKIHLKAEEKLSDLGVNQKRVTVEIAFGSNVQARLGSNMDVEITVEKKENVLRVSELAVFEKSGEDCVYVVEGGKAVLRQIKTGLEGEDYYEVLSGLEEGDMVILSPADDISEGVRIKNTVKEE